MLSSLAATGMRRKEKTVAKELTARDKMILQMIEREYSDQHIADTLGIAKRSLQKVVRDILKKLEVKKRHHAIETAKNRKLI